VILASQRRIGEELKKVPKASGGDRSKTDASVSFAAEGKGATGLSKMERRSSLKQ
jgi:hypothetical protein